MAGVKRSITTDHVPASKIAGQNGDPKTLQISLHELQLAACPSLQKPQEITSFSVVVNDQTLTQKEEDITLNKYAVSNNCARTLSNDSLINRLDLVVPDTLNSLKLDLNVGYGKQTEKNRENEFLSTLLQSLDQAKLVGSSEFVCWRGLLTKIAASPYDAAGKFDDGMKLVAQRVNGVIYLCEFPTEQFKKKQGTLNEQQKLMQYWGMKFETYVTATPGEKPLVEQPMDLNLEYGVAVRTKLEKHSLVFGGEVDCAWPENRNRYVELKTTRIFTHPGNERSFRRFKLMKWWLQSFLIGIEDILCGFRDDDGIVRYCQWFKVSDIPQIIKQDRDTWKPSACLTFLKQFLDFLKANVTDDLLPFVFTRLPGEKTFHVTTDECGEHKFLPQWFVEKYSAI